MPFLESQHLPRQNYSGKGGRIADVIKKVTNKRKSRKGFSLVELVVVIIIIAVLAVAVFAGGSAVIRRSQVSRTVSDLHNFSVAIETAMNENPSVANMTNANTLESGVSTGGMYKIITVVNELLSTDYQINFEEEGQGNVVSTIDGNIKVNAGAGTDGTYVIFKSKKTDAWDNPYYIIFDCSERHLKGMSEFYITIISAGPNAQTVIGQDIEADDIFLLVQYTDGDVAAKTHNVADDNIFVAASTYTKENPKYTYLGFKDKGKEFDPLGTSRVRGIYSGGFNNEDSYAGKIKAGDINCGLPVNF